MTASRTSGWCGADGRSQHFVVGRVARQVHARPLIHADHVADVVQVVGAEGDGKRGADPEIAHAIHFVRPGHHDLLTRDSRLLKSFDGFRRSEKRALATRGSITGNRFGIEVVAVAVRDRVQIEHHEVRGGEGRGHEPVQIEAGLLADRLAGIGQVGVDGDEPALRALEQKPPCPSHQSVMAPLGTRKLRRSSWLIVFMVHRWSLISLTAHSSRRLGLRPDPLSHQSQLHPDQLSRRLGTPSRHSSQSQSTHSVGPVPLSSVTTPRPTQS